MRSVFAFNLLLILLLSGCKSTYYGTWEKLGWAKRDILVDRVKDARDEQQGAKEQFKTTLQKFQELTKFQGGELESKYKKLNGEYEECADRAEAVTTRVKSIDSVANDMFKEWETELSQYDNPKLRASSQEKLDQTRNRYADLIAAMRKSESTMKPVLNAFRDQVLFLKHNLNAQAIASLQETTVEIESDVQKLIADMEASIAEANEFIGNLKG